MAQQIERNQEATVYVGNLDERCTDSLIWELMLQAGPVGKWIYYFNERSFAKALFDYST